MKSIIGASSVMNLFCVISAFSTERNKVVAVSVRVSMDELGWPIKC